MIVLESLASSNRFDLPVLLNLSVLYDSTTVDGANPWKGCTAPPLGVGFDFFVELLFLLLLLVVLGAVNDDDEENFLEDDDGIDLLTLVVLDGTEVVFEPYFGGEGLLVL